MRKEFKYNIVIRMLIEGYLNLNFCAMLDVKEVNLMFSIGK